MATGQSQLPGSMYSISQIPGTNHMLISAKGLAVNQIWYYDNWQEQAQGKRVTNVVVNCYRKNESSYLNNNGKP